MGVVALWLLLRLRIRVGLCVVLISAGWNCRREENTVIDSKWNLGFVCALMWRWLGGKNGRGYVVGQKSWCGEKRVREALVGVTNIHLSKHITESTRNSP